MTASAAVPADGEQAERHTGGLRCERGRVGEHRRDVEHQRAHERELGDDVVGEPVGRHDGATRLAAAHAALDDPEA